MDLELATAYVSISSSARGLRKEVDRELGSIGDAAGSKAGKSFVDRLGSVVKTGAKVVGGVVAAGLGTALVKGFGRLTAIENAQAKLTGLGNDAKSVDVIMGNALASVKGTAFGLGEAATTAAGAVAAGIKPGQALEGVLKSVANSAAASGTSMEEMGGIYNKVASTGKAQNDVLRQVAERGIPIYEKLAEQLGVTSEEVFEMASAGEIGFAQFEKAMTSASGTVADEMGKTFTGSWANMIAGLGRLGASFLGPAFEQMAPLLQDITAGIDLLGPAAERAGTIVGGVLAEGIRQASMFINGLTGNIEIMDQSARPRMELLGIGVRALVKSFQDGDVTSDGFVGKMEKVGATAGRVYDEITKGVNDFSNGLTGNVAIMDQSARPKLELLGIGVRALVSSFKDGDVTSDGFVGAMEKIGSGARTVFDYLQNTALPVAVDLFESIRTMDGSKFQATMKDLEPSIESIKTSMVDLQPAFTAFKDDLPNIASAVGTLAAGAIKVLSAGLAFLASHVDTIIKFMPVIVAGFLAWRAANVVAASSTNRLVAAQVAMTPVVTLNNILRIAAVRAEARLTAAQAANTASTAANTVAGTTNNATKSRGIIMATAHRAAILAQTVATKAATAAQKLLNLALKMNPIGLVIVAVTALVAAIVWLYKNNETARRVIDKAWSMIQAGISKVVNWFKDRAWPWMRDALDSMKDRFTSTKDSAVAAWDRLQDGISRGWSKIESVFDKFKSGLSSLRDRVRSIKNGIGDMWSGLTRTFAGPIRGVIQFVNDNFLAKLENALNKIPGVTISLPRISVPNMPSTRPSGGGSGRGAAMLADGSWVPGHSPHPKADNIPAMLTAKEFVVRRLSALKLKRKHPGALEHMNRTGELPRYASGGEVGGSPSRTGGVLGDGWDWITGVFGNAKDFIKKQIDKFMSGIGSSWPAQAAVGAAGSVASKIGEWIKEKFGGSDEGGRGGAGNVNYGGGYGQHPSGMHWSQIWSLIKAAVPNAIMTSNFRGGAITASGIPSLHGLGRAVDWITPGMSGMTAAFRKVGSMLPWSQHFYTPAGSGLQQGFVDDAIRRMHNNHAHTALAMGGYVKKLNTKAFSGMPPLLFDSGGYLPEGTSLVHNGTGAPEPLRRVDEDGGPKVVQHIKIMYPQAEPHSVATKKSLQYAAATLG